MDAYNRCKILGGEVKIVVTDKRTGEKRRVCSGAKSKHPITGKMIDWGPVAEAQVYKPRKEPK